MLSVTHAPFKLTESKNLSLTPDIDIANLSVRLSVRYVPVLYENGLTYCHSFFSPYGSPITLVLSASNIFTKFRRGHPLLLTYANVCSLFTLQFCSLLHFWRFIAFGPAFSTPIHWCHMFKSRVFDPCIFDVPRLPFSHFQSPHRVVSHTSLMRENS